MTVVLPRRLPGNGEPSYRFAPASGGFGSLRWGFDWAVKGGGGFGSALWFWGGRNFWSGRGGGEIFPVNSANGGRPSIGRTFAWGRGAVGT